SNLAGREKGPSGSLAPSAPTHHHFEFFRISCDQHFPLDSFVREDSARVGGCLEMPCQRPSPVPLMGDRPRRQQKSSLGPQSPPWIAPRWLRKRGVESRQGRPPWTSIRPSSSR